MLSLPAGAGKEQITKIRRAIDKIAVELPGKVSRHYSLNRLRKENERLAGEIEERYKEIEKVYLESLKAVGKPKKRTEYEALNGELDKLNEQQTKALIRRSLVQLAMAKKFLGQGPKLRKSMKRSRPNLGPAMGLVAGVRENMRRVTVEIYWKRARQHILAFGRKFVKEFEAEGLYGEPVRTISLADWDVHILERGPITVKMIHWDRVLTSFGRKVRAPIWKEVRFDDIEAACRAHVHIMESQHHEILKILSSLSQLQYVIDSLSSYKDDTRLPSKLKEQVAAELGLYYLWLKRGFVRPKQLGAKDLKEAISSIEKGEVKKAIELITYVQNRLRERKDKIEDIKKRVRSRFASFNDERKRLAAKDEDIRLSLRRAAGIMGIKTGATLKAAKVLNLESLQGAEAQLTSLLNRYFKRVRSHSQTPKAKARRKIEATIEMLHNIRDDLKKRNAISAGKDLEAADIEGQITELQKSITGAEELSRSIQDTIRRINEVRDLLQVLIAEIPGGFKREMENNISVLLTATKRINPAHCSNQLKRVAERLNALLQNDSIHSNTKDEIGSIIRLIIDIIPAAVSNYKFIQDFSPPPGVFGSNGAAVSKKFLEEKYPEQAHKKIAELNEKITGLATKIKQKKPTSKKARPLLAELNRGIGAKLSAVFDNISAKSAAGISSTVIKGLAPVQGKTSSLGLIRQIRLNESTFKIIKSGIENGFNIRRALEGRTIIAGGDIPPVYKALWEAIPRLIERGLFELNGFSGDLFLKVAEDLESVSIRRRNTVYLDRGVIEELLDSENGNVRYGTTLLWVLYVALSNEIRHSSTEKSHYSEYREEVFCTAAEVEAYNRLNSSQQGEIKAWLRKRDKDNAFTGKMNDFIKLAEANRDRIDQRQVEDFIQSHNSRFSNIEERRQRAKDKIADLLGTKGIRGILKDEYLRALVIDYDLAGHPDLKGAFSLPRRIAMLRNENSTLVEHPVLGYGDTYSSLGLITEKKADGSIILEDGLTFGAEVDRFILDNPYEKTLALIESINEQFAHGERGYPFFDYAGIYARRDSLYRHRGAKPLSEWHKEWRTFGNTIMSRFAPEAIRFIQRQLKDKPKNLFADNVLISQFAKELSEKKEYGDIDIDPQKAPVGFVLECMTRALNTYFSRNFSGEIKDLRPFDSALTRYAIGQAGYGFRKRAKRRSHPVDSWQDFKKSDLSVIIEEFITSENGRFVIDEAIYDSEELRRFMETYDMDRDDARDCIGELLERSMSEAQLGKTFETTAVLMYKILHPDRKFRYQYHILGKARADGEEEVEGFLDLVYFDEDKKCWFPIEIKLGGTEGMRTSARNSINKYWRMINRSGLPAARDFAREQPIQLCLLHRDEALEQDAHLEGRARFTSSEELTKDIRKKVDRELAELFTHILSEMQRIHLYTEPNMPEELTKEELRDIEAYLRTIIVHILERPLAEEQIEDLKEFLKLLTRYYFYDDSLGSPPLKDKGLLDNFIERRFGRIIRDDVKYNPPAIAEYNEVTGYQNLWDEAFEDRIKQRINKRKMMAKTTRRSKIAVVGKAGVSRHNLAREYAAHLQESAGPRLDEVAARVADEYYRIAKGHPYSGRNTFMAMVFFDTMDIQNELREAIAVEDISISEINFVEGCIKKMTHNDVTAPEAERLSGCLENFVMGFDRHIARYLALRIAWQEVLDDLSGSYSANMDKLNYLLKKIGATLGVMTEEEEEKAPHELREGYKPSLANQLTLACSLSAYYNEALPERKFNLYRLLKSHMWGWRAPVHRVEDRTGSDYLLFLNIVLQMGLSGALTLQDIFCENKTILSFEVATACYDHEQTPDNMKSVVHEKFPKEKGTLMEVGKLIAYLETEKAAKDMESAPLSASKFKGNVACLKETLLHYLSAEEREYLTQGYNDYKSGVDRKIVMPHPPIAVPIKKTNNFFRDFKRILERGYGCTYSSLSVLSNLVACVEENLIDKNYTGADAHLIPHIRKHIPVMVDTLSDDPLMAFYLFLDHGRRIGMYSSEGFELLIERVAGHIEHDSKGAFSKILRAGLSGEIMLNLLDSFKFAGRVENIDKVFEQYLDMYDPEVTIGLICLYKSLLTTIAEGKPERVSLLLAGLFQKLIKRDGLILTPALMHVVSYLIGDIEFRGEYYRQIFESYLLAVFNYLPDAIEDDTVKAEALRIRRFLEESERFLSQYYSSRTRNLVLPGEIIEKYLLEMNRQGFINKAREAVRDKSRESIRAESVNYALGLCHDMFLDEPSDRLSVVKAAFGSHATEELFGFIAGNYAKTQGVQQLAEQAPLPGSEIVEADVIYFSELLDRLGFAGDWLDFFDRINERIREKAASEAAKEFQQQSGGAQTEQAQTETTAGFKLKFVTGELGAIGGEELTKLHEAMDITGDSQLSPEEIKERLPEMIRYYVGGGFYDLDFLADNESDGTIVVMIEKGKGFMPPDELFNERDIDFVAKAAENSKGKRTYNVIKEHLDLALSNLKQIHPDSIPEILLTLLPAKIAKRVVADPQNFIKDTKAKLVEMAVDTLVQEIMEEKGIDMDINTDSRKNQQPLRVNPAQEAATAMLISEAA